MTIRDKEGITLGTLEDLMHNVATVGGLERADSVGLLLKLLVKMEFADSVAL